MEGGGGGMLCRGMDRLMGQGMKIWGCLFCDLYSLVILVMRIKIRLFRIHFFAGI